MKKTRLIILLAALTCLAALALVGCGDDSHAHDFGGEWAHDSESHWHACAEEGCDGVADKAAHTFGEATPGAAATCYSNGTETYTCSECGFVKTAETDTLEHTPATTLSHDGSAHWYACTADGCTAHLSETKHEWSGWSLSETNTPTLTAGGKVTRECTVDGCGGVGEYVLPALTSVYYTVSDNDATIYAGGQGTYVYSKDGVEVSFAAETAELPSLSVQITVLTADGAPVSGVEAVLDGTEYGGETDTDGVAAFKAEHLKGDDDFYTVVLEGTPEGLVYGKMKVTESAYNVTVYLARSLESGTSEDNAKAVDLGIHAVTVTARRDPESGVIATVDRYLKFKASEAGTYTVTLLDDGSYASVILGNVSDMLQPRGSAKVVLEAGDTVYYAFVSDDGEVASGYRQPVVFKLEKSEAPALGTLERPVRLNSGEAGSAATASPEQKVYFRLTGGEYGRYAKIDFGAGVQVCWLGYGLSAVGESVASGNVVRVSEYGHSYFYATGSGSNVEVTATAHYIEGMAQNPFVAKLDGTENAVNVGVNGESEVWYAVTSAAAGKYIVKPSSPLAAFELYNAVTDSAYVKRSGAGAAMVLTLKADVTVYLRATESNLNEFTFTCAPASDSDEGLSADNPIEVTAGDYTLNAKAGEEANTYFKIAATQDSVVTLTHASVTGMPAHYVYLWIFNNEEFALKLNSIDSKNTGLVYNTFGNVVKNTGKFTYSFEMTGGTTYYFYYTIASLDPSFDPKLNVDIKQLVPHDYEINILLPDGETGVENVTVNLLDGATVVATQTTSGVGRVTFAAIDSRKDYTLTLGELPTGYGYYASQTKIAKNYDDKTVFDLVLTAYVEYKLTVKLPDGTPVDGVGLALTCNAMPSFEGTTGADGVYTVFTLPPEGSSSSYRVVFTLPESLTSMYYTPAALYLKANDPQKEVTLGEYFTVTITVTDTEGNKLEGVKVNLGELTGTSNADGVVAISGVDPNASYPFSVEKENYALYKYNNTDRFGVEFNTTITEDKKDSLTIVCMFLDGKKAVGAGATSSAGEMNVGENLVKTQSGKVFVKFTAAGEGEVTYRITVTAVDNINMCGVANIYHNNVQKFNQGQYPSSGKTVITAEESLMSGMILTTFTVTVSGGDEVKLKLNGVGLMNVSIEAVQAA